ncbi:DUF3489 domain-containing protein [Sphingomonas baiyangensis]|uniref:DUF3489 domain-containing protein n=1 Tax=Sphingomonas baiyangensis TaxID=2572576 RepID=A0A4U1L5P1_9SPHN|nr:DUF3489 domain-containing protein [Sphingomonas baiyangensis]TKD51545.1 DUF3489 domain-containing protein [Sphingomonas baiyangensis]
MMKLNDAQRVLLSAAAQRDSGSLYPLPEVLAAGRADKAIAGLVARGLADERETGDLANVYRSDGDLRFGMFVTAAGLAAIDAGPKHVDSVDSVPAPLAAPDVKRLSKSAAVISLLRRDTGATLGELIEATGWLPHTTRAALTGLRKKGHAIERSKRGDATCYRIEAAS